MYSVSQAYKKEMRGPVREVNAEATVYFGMFDQTAAGDATLDWAEALLYAEPRRIKEPDEPTASYATFERDALRLDGVQMLLPSRPEFREAQGYISSVVSGENGRFAESPYIDVSFKVPHSMVGLTIQFDPYFPLPEQFSVISYRGGEQIKTDTVTEHIEPLYIGEFLLYEVDRIVIRFDKMPWPGVRARINHVSFGIGYQYSGNVLKTVNEKHSGSPLSLELPSSDMKFDIDNSDGRFDVESDMALQRFLADGQKASVVYKIGEQTVPGRTWNLSGWKVSGVTASFSAKDEIGRLNDTTYEKGVYDGAARTLYELAESVLEDAGIEARYIDPYLMGISTTAPLPLKSHAECLQLIANAGECQLFVSRDNNVTLLRVKSHVETVTAVSDTTQTIYSDAATATREDNVIYATFEPSFIRLDGEQRLVPSDGDYLAAGWTAETVSDGNGMFSENEILLEFDDLTNVYNVTVDWGLSVPKIAEISCREDGMWKNTTRIRPSADVEDYAVAFRHCDAIKVALVKAGVPGQRPRVRALKTSIVSDFTLSKEQLFHGYKAAVEPKLRNVIMTYKRYIAEAEKTDIATIETTTNIGTLAVQHDLCLDPVVTVENGAGVTVSAEHHAYISYISFTASTERPIKAYLRGYKVTAENRNTVANANDTGEDIQIENGIVTEKENAQGVSEWVRDYYMSRITYEDEIRGFPEIDLFDLVYLHDGNTATVTASDLTFNGAFRQKLSVRREGAL